MKVAIRTQEDLPTTIVRTDDNNISVFVHQCDNVFALINSAYTPDYGGDGTWQVIGVFNDTTQASEALETLKQGAVIVPGTPMTAIEYLQEAGFKITSPLRRAFCRFSALGLIQQTFGQVTKRHNKKSRRHKKKRS